MSNPIVGRGRRGAVIMPLLRMLIVVAAAVALFVVFQHRQGDQKWRVYAAELRVALRSVATAESGVRRQTGSFTSDLALLSGELGYVGPSVSITIDRADKSGWLASARHDMVTLTCQIEGTHAGGADSVTRLVCSGRAKFTAAYDSVRAGLAPRLAFAQWMRER